MQVEGVVQRCVGVERCLECGWVEWGEWTEQF